jgi:hypothetical protein
LALEIAQTEAPAALAKGPGPSPISGPGPGLGPGRGAGLGADPRAATDEGPILDLSLDDQVYEGSETNDDFLNMFEDEGEKK